MGSRSRARCGARASLPGRKFGAVKAGRKDSFSRALGRLFAEGREERADPARHDPGTVRNRLRRGRVTARLPASGS